MKTKLFTLLLAVAASVGTMFASTKIDDLYYSFDATNKTAKVTYELRESNNYQGLTTANIPASVTYSGTTYSVTSIGDRAFDGCSSLTSVTIGNSVTSIGYWAFQNCSSLTSVTIPNSVTSIGLSAFYGCSGLTSVTIGNSVTSIGSGAFGYCSSLTSVTIPNSVTSIRNDAFNGCSSLTSISVESGNTIYESRNNCNAIIETASNTLIVGCKNTIIPNSVTSIGDYAFCGCSSLTSVTIPNSVTSIGYYAFGHCSSLTSVTIGNGVTSIGKYAFYGCSSLTSVTIPNSVISIGGSAFSGCSGLTSVTIGNGVTSIGSSAFRNCSGLTSVTIGNSVTSIGSEAFMNCSSLTKVNITDIAAWCNIAFGGITSNPLSYGNHLFVNDVEVTDLVIPAGVTSIGQYAFRNCSGLTSVTIPNSVTSIGYWAFEGCSGLISIYVPCGEMERFKQMLNNDSRINDHAPLPYTITIYATNGNVTYPQTICDDMLLNATPDYGYHFVKWSDGNTDNPRTIELTQDITLTAEFVKNTYTISTTSANPEWGITAGGSTLYLDNIVISATPNYGYHFVKWNDNNTSNPRTISVTENKTYTATFAKNVYTITKNATNGTISSNSSAEYLDEVMLTAIPNYGYHFTQWSDGVTDNPHTIVLTQDTTFTAEFAKNTYAISTSSANPEWGTTTGGSALYLDNIEISATPNYGYHFVKWNDNNTSNPRTVSVTEDKTYIATFAKNIYTITKNANNGTISGNTSAEYMDKVTLTANSDYGYHFTKWSDGNTDNPRTIELTQDTTFTAEFAKNTYTISTTSANPEWGTTAGGKSALYMDEVEISAIANYGYHFVHWSDYNTEPTRTIVVERDSVITATFAKNIYTITKNAEHGTISGNSSAEYLDYVTLIVIPDYGYHFVKWSDGNTDNPRTIELRQDTTLEAIFAVDKYGTCGDNLQLTWRYDTGSQTLTISGEGDLTTNMRYGIEAVKEMKELVIEDGVGVIGNEAFANIKTLNTITLGKDVRKLQERVFYNCYNLTAIYNYRKTPASATSNTFEEVDKYACTIYVLAGSEEMFRSATGWKDFYSILAIGATETTVTDNKVSVEPSDNSATVTWPVSNEATSYTIDITKDGVVFCRLTFNANGQLTGIAFAPGRDGQSMAPAAVMTANGLQFTVTGLNSGTQYGYNVTAKDANEQPIATYSGSFTTTSEGVDTGIGNTAVESKITKILRNGEVLILRDGKTYTIQGVELK